MTATDSLFRRDHARLFDNVSPSGIDIDNLAGIEELLVSWANSATRKISLERTKVLLPYSDLNAANVIYAYFNSELRYSEDTKVWRVWNGRVYDLVDPDTVSRMIGTFARSVAAALAIVREEFEIAALAAGPIGTPPYINMIKTYNIAWKEYRDYRDRLHNRRGLADLKAVLMSRCAASENLLDGDTSIFVLENGVLDLDHVMEHKEVSILQHDPVRYVSKFAPIKYDVRAKSPIWDKYLQRSVPDAETREYLQRWCGLALLGKPVDKGFINLLGPSDSGKSVFVEMIIDLMGAYAVAVGPSTFMSKNKGDQGFDIHELRGRRFVVTSEPPEGHSLDDNVLKQLTGGDTLHTRTLFQGFVNWTPQCLVFIASNHPLKFNVTDEAMKARYKPISFPHTFLRAANAPEHLRADLKLRDKLKAERSGILNWFLDGLIMYARTGIGFEPTALRDSRNELTREIDNRSDWLDEMLQTGAIVEIAEDEDVPASSCLKAGDAFAAYRYWAQERGEHVFSDRQLGKIIRQQFPDTKMSAGVRFIQLREGDKWIKRN